MSVAIAVAIVMIALFFIHIDLLIKKNKQSLKILLFCIYLYINEHYCPVKIF